MLIRRAPDIPSREITDETLYWSRREWLASVGLGLAGSVALPGWLGAQKEQLKPTSYDIITGYNNYYEFGTGKDDPKANAHTLRPKPWSIAVEGEVKKPAVYSFDDFFKGMTPEERVYLHERYMTELLKGIILPETRERLQEIIDNLKQRERIQGVILAGTELPLILRGEDRDIPFLDTTQIHVNAAVKQLLS